MQANDHDMRSKDRDDLVPIDGIKMRHGELKIFQRAADHIVFANGTENIAIT